MNLKYYVLICALSWFQACIFQNNSTSNIDMDLSQRNLETSWERKAYNQQLAIVEDYVGQTTTDADRKKIEAEITEEIKDWIEKYTSTGFFKTEDYVISDNIIFNKQKDQALFFLVAIKKRNQNGQAVTISACKVAGQEKWEYFYGGLPNFVYKYHADLRDDELFSLREIELKTIDKFCEDGLVKHGEIDQKYFRKWYRKRIK